MIHSLRCFKAAVPALIVLLASFSACSKPAPQLPEVSIALNLPATIKATPGTSLQFNYVRSKSAKMGDILVFTKDGQEITAPITAVDPPSALFTFIVPEGITEGTWKVSVRREDKEFAVNNVTFSMLAQAYRFRLMQFNILQGDGVSETAGHEWVAVRRDPCVAMFKDIDPDIACLQEARKKQCAYLEEKLPQYTQIKHPKDNVESNGGQRNLIMYKADKFELVRWDKFWFSVDGTASGDRFGDSATTQKFVLWAQFREKETGQLFYVYDTHFFASCNIESTRDNCARMCLESMKKVAGESSPVFLCGDMNCQPGSTPLNMLSDWMQHAASTALASDGAGITTYNKFGASTKVLDHIFYRGATANTYKVVNAPSYGTQYISDHYPIYSDFVIEY